MKGKAVLFTHSLERLSGQKPFKKVFPPPLAVAPKMKYRVPISLWLIEKRHRTRFVIFFVLISNPIREGPLRLDGKRGGRG
jgi:hypothetical protein